MDDVIDIDSLLDRAWLSRSMTREEQKAYLSDVREALAWLDENEPRKKTSEDYELWCDCHEDLEDLADELTELLEE